MTKNALRRTLLLDEAPVWRSCRPITAQSQHTSSALKGELRLQKTDPDLIMDFITGKEILKHLEHVLDILGSPKMAC